MKNRDINVSNQNIISVKAIAIGSVTDLIENFSISADSVVATAEVKVKNGVTHFRLDWGDGHVSRINLISSVVVHYGSTTMLADGTYSLQHAYNVSDDGLQFQIASMLIAYGPDNRSEYRITSLAIRPKYQVWFSDILVRMVEDAEPYYESVNEWEITQSSTGIIHTSAPYSEVIGERLKWTFEISQDILPSAWYKLEGSRKTHAIFKNERMSSVIAMSEIDFHDDDYFVTSIIFFGGVAVEDEVQLKVGPIEIRYAQTMTLINRLRNFTPPLML